MHTHSGICVDSYVKIDDSCAMNVEVDDEQAILRVGGVRSTGITLALSKTSVARLIAVSTDALRALQDHDKG